MKKKENPTEFQKELSIRIKKRRKELNLTYIEVSQATGLSPSTLLRYESGEIRNIPADKIELLSDVLKMNPAELMGWEIKDFDYLSKDEKNIVDNFRKFNSNGKDKIVEYINDISLINKYKDNRFCEKHNYHEIPIDTRRARNDNQDSGDEQKLMDKDFEMMKEWKNNK